MIAPILHDVLVLGAGPGGLAAATALARQLYSVLVLSNGVFRNAPTSHMHNFLGWDHASPETFRAKARSDLLARYSTVQFQDDVKVTQLSQLEDSTFEVTGTSTSREACLSPSNRLIHSDAAVPAVDRQSKWRARKVILAMGVSDIPELIPGYAENWGRGIFHCLFCHGFEERSPTGRAGILATGEVGNATSALHVARMARRLAGRVSILTNGNTRLAQEIDQMIQSKGNARGIETDRRSIVRLQGIEVQTGTPAQELDGLITVAFTDGAEERLAFLAHKPEVAINGAELAHQLGIELTPQGLFQVGSPIPQTNIKGVFAVGDCATLMGAVITAAMAGTLAGTGAAFQLQEEIFLDEGKL